MDKKFLIAIIISIIGVTGFLAGMFFIGVYSIVITLICYFIIYEKYRKYFWKSFIIGIIIGFPLGLYFGFNYYVWYTSTPEYRQVMGEAFQEHFQTGPKALDILDTNSRCFGNSIYLQVNNPSKEPIKANEIQIEYIEGSCENYRIDVDEFKPNILEIESIWFDDCATGTNTIKIISPEGEDQITIECSD